MSAGAGPSSGLRPDSLTKSFMAWSAPESCFIKVNTIAVISRDTYPLREIPQKARQQRQYGYKVRIEWQIDRARMLFVQRCDDRFRYRHWRKARDEKGRELETMWDIIDDTMATALEEDEKAQRDAVSGSDEQVTVFDRIARVAKEHALIWDFGMGQFSFWFKWMIEVDALFLAFLASLRV